MALTALVALLGLSALIEMVYHRQLEGASGSALHFLGMSLDVSNALHWLAAAAVAALGVALFEWVRRRFQVRWHTVQEAIEKALKQREQAA
jgi:branched-chain amino acid transport system permease protein